MRDPDVIPILEPAQGREEVEGAKYGPHAPELPQHPADRRRPLKLLPIRLDSPSRPLRLVAGEADSLDQPGLLVRPRIDPACSIVALDPAREPNSKVALAVVDDYQPVICHGPKLHCS